LRLRVILDSFLAADFHKNPNLSIFFRLFAHNDNAGVRSPSRDIQTKTITTPGNDLVEFSPVVQPDWPFILQISWADYGEKTILAEIAFRPQASFRKDDALYLPNLNMPARQRGFAALRLSHAAAPIVPTAATSPARSQHIT